MDAVEVVEVVVAEDGEDQEDVAEAEGEDFRRIVVGTTNDYHPKCSMIWICAVLRSLTEFRKIYVRHSRLVDLVYKS